MKNSTLAKFSKAYGFDQIVKLPRNFYIAEDPRSRATGKVWEKMLGDVFEAYCAAVVLSYRENPTAGYAVLETWLTALWQPAILLEKQRNSQPSDGNAGGIGPEATWPPLDLLAKQTLNQKLGGTNTRTFFRDLSPVDNRTLKDQGKEIYHIGCYFTGWGWNEQFLGEGKGLSKKDAGMRAATEGIGNVVTGQIEMVKREYDKRVKEERDRERIERRERGEGGGYADEGLPATKKQKH